MSFTTFQNEELLYRHPKDSVPIQEMQARFNAYDDESRQFLFFGGWVDMTWPERNERQAEIDRKHGYVHGWIVVDGVSFDRYQAFPDCSFANVWD